MITWAIPLTALVISPSAALELLCGPASADAQARTRFVAVALVDGQPVAATQVQVQETGGALAAVDELGRVLLTVLTPVPQLRLRVTTAAGLVEGVCRDAAARDPLRFVDVPGRLLAGTKSVTWELAGMGAERAEVLTSLGEVRLEPRRGNTTVRLTLPRSATPDVAVVSAWVQVDGRVQRALAVIPVVASVVIPGTSEPLAQVEMEVVGQRFGPVRADRAGQFALRVDLPPGITAVKALSTDPAGNHSARDVEIPVPAVHRAGALLAWPAAWHGRATRLWFALGDARGAPSAHEDVSVGWQGGPRVIAHAMGDGWYTAVLPPATAPAAVALVATAWSGATELAQLPVPRGVAAPQQIAIRALDDEPWALRGGAGERAVAQVTVVDAAGLPSRDLVLGAEVDAVAAPIVEAGLGALVQALPPANNALMRVVRVRVEGRRMPCRATHLRAALAERWTIAAVDDSGLICPGAELALGGTRTYGSAAWPAAGSGTLRHLEVAWQGQRVVFPWVTGPTGPWPLTSDADDDVPLRLQVVAQLPVAPALVAVRATATDAGVLVRVVDGDGNASAGRELRVWPPQACAELRPGAGSTWTCIAPRAGQVVFTDQQSGTSVMLDLRPQPGERP